MNTTKILRLVPVVLAFTTGLVALNNGVAADEVKGVDDLKPSHRPALNYPQAVAWVNARSIDSVYTLRASDVIGRTVHNGVGTELGQVDDLIIVNNNGEQAVQVIVEAGGFLGLGERLVAVPFSEFKINPDDDEIVYFNITDEQLKSLPEFNYGIGEENGKTIFEKSRTRSKPDS